MEHEEAKKTSNRIEKTAAQKVAEIAEKMATSPRQKESPKDAVLDAVKAQKSNFKKALKNGYTKKEILSKLKEKGFSINSRDLAMILGTKKKAKNNSARTGIRGTVETE